MHKNRVYLRGQTCNSRDGFVLNRLYTRLQAKIRARRRYRALIAEIEMLSQADLMELGAFQIDLYRAARRETFG